MLRQIRHGRIRWVVIFVGFIAILLLASLLMASVGSVGSSYLYDTFAVERPGGAVSFTGRAWDVYMFSSTLVFLSCLLAAFFLGSVVVGRMVLAFPGLNGAVSGAAVMAAAWVWLLGGAIPFLLRPINDPGDVYTRAENLQMFLLWMVVLCVISPLGILAGYLGGRLGGRLRRRPARSSADAPTPGRFIR